MEGYPGCGEWPNKGWVHPGFEESLINGEKIYYS
jgi:hypothetical protein